MNDKLSDQDTQAVFDILVEQLGVQRTQLTPSARIEADLGADSLDLVEITMALEDRFAISVPDEDWGKISTVSDLLDSLETFLVARK